jgi:hypothetical protein
MKGVRLTKNTTPTEAIVELQLERDGERIDTFACAVGETVVFVFIKIHMNQALIDKKN